MKNLKAFLQRQIEEKKTIYPKGDEYFLALNLTPLDKVKVVILGQDPYHGPGQAHGERSVSFQAQGKGRFEFFRAVTEQLSVGAGRSLACILGDPPHGE
jgi:uracil DNA glycosylase